MTASNLDGSRPRRCSLAATALALSVKGRKAGTQVAKVGGMNWLLGGLSGLALGFFASNAGAQVAQAEATEPAAPHTVNAAPQEQAPVELDSRRWYGWQGLAVDAGASAAWLTSMALLSSDESSGYERRETTAQVLMIAGGVGYMAGGPTTHWLHGRKWQALGSFGIRGGLPVVGGLIGLNAATCPPPHGDYGNCGLPELLLGAAAGAVVAMALDASLLGWETPQTDRQPKATLGISPVVSSDGRRELRVFGTF